MTFDTLLTLKMINYWELLWIRRVKSQQFSQSVQWLMFFPCRPTPAFVVLNTSGLNSSVSDTLVLSSVWLSCKRVTHTKSTRRMLFRGLASCQLSAGTNLHCFSLASDQSHGSSDSQKLPAADILQSTAAEVWWVWWDQTLRSNSLGHFSSYFNQEKCQKVKRNTF